MRTSLAHLLHFTMGGSGEEEEEEARRTSARTWQKRARLREVPRSGRVWFQVKGRVAGAREGRGLLLPLTCRSKAEPQQRR